MTNFARTAARAAGHRRTVSVLLAALAACMLLAALAAPAGAVVTEVEGTQVGLQPRSTSLVTPEGGFGGPPAKGSFSNLSGNVVVNGADVYLVYWDPGAVYHPEWIRKVDEFAHNLAADSGQDGTIFDALSQYRDRANEGAAFNFDFAGAYNVTTPYPSSECTSPPRALEVGLDTCLTDAQLRTELSNWIAAQGKPKGMHAIYFVLTPPGVTVCLTAASSHCSDYTVSKTEAEKPRERKTVSYQNSFCSYHGDINPNKAAEGDSSTVLYAAIPWTAGYEGEGGPWDFIPTEAMSGNAVDCQAGGWSPGAGSETEEKTPNVQEPNQEGRGEEGDYTPGLADLIDNQIAVEQANIVTDPLLSSWHNTFTGSEATDECRDVFAAWASPSQIGGGVAATGPTEAGTLSNENIQGSLYYINNVIDLGELHYPRCVGGVGLVPRFTAPARANVNETVSFDGLESNITEFKSAVYGASGPPTLTYAKFTWEFGDGSAPVTGYAPGSPACESNWLSPCAASVNHTYKAGGTYDVTLTVTDAGGNVASTANAVTIAGPPPAPAITTPGATGPAATSSASGAGKGSGSALPAPSARAAVASRSLRTALRSGLAVSYAVNQEVTGHFEILMARSLASRLHISGTPAIGLPAGTAPQLVIAKAVLVTTKAGSSVVHIKFSKQTAARLKRVKSAPLMLRLVVRNGASSSAVLSAVTLTG